MVARMGTKTRELLYMLLWTCDVSTRPTWRNLTDSFEGWAYRKGLLRQLQRLEAQQFIEQTSGDSADRLFRLTDAGRLQALGGRDPLRRWEWQWDGHWRVILFDVPESRRAYRLRLRQCLRERGFGCLQGSVWVTPHPAHEERALLCDGEVNVESLILLESCPCAGETDSQIIDGAWDFTEINGRYDQYEKVLMRRPKSGLETKESARTFHQWIQAERRAWLDAINHDPLLPECLWPAGYAGREAWNRRLEVMKEAGKQMRAFPASQS
jgi:phenylacetic acid degradation operon negative regulatory protein